MTMRLARISGNLLALLAMSLFVVLVAGAQGTKPAKAHAHKAGKAAHASQTSAAGPAATPAAENGESVAIRRDPFLPLVNMGKDNGLHLPPGKAGLVISTVRVDGAVSSPDGMIAVVSNPGNHVYFIREGDHLYDGEVEKIGLDGVTFRENTKDAFGKMVERTVTKRIFASAGEHQ
ncbi:MAG: pilus assembly protein PilP [Candidatus Acidiferrales bacterium]